MAQRRLVLWLRVSDPQCSPGRNGLAWPPAPGREASAPLAGVGDRTWPSGAATSWGQRRPWPGTGCEGKLSSGHGTTQSPFWAWGCGEVEGGGFTGGGGGGGGGEGERKGRHSRQRGQRGK